VKTSHQFLRIVCFFLSVVAAVVLNFPWCLCFLRTYREAAKEGFISVARAIYSNALSEFPTKAIQLDHLNLCLPRLLIRYILHPTTSFVNNITYTIILKNNKYGQLQLYTYSGTKNLDFLSMYFCVRFTNRSLINCKHSDFSTHHSVHIGHCCIRR